MNEFPIPVVQRELIPEGTHAAICVQLIDVGTQKMVWKERVDFVRRIRLAWEFPEITREFTDDEGETKTAPAMLGRELSLSLGKRSALRGILGTWGVLKAVEEGVGLGLLLGLPALLTVEHVEKDGKTYDNIVGVSGLPQGFSVPEPVNEPLMLHMGSAENPQLDRHVYDSLPGWIQERIQESDEYKAMAIGVKTTDEIDEELEDHGL